jgi:hypothetical protein
MQHQYFENEIGEILTSQLMINSKGEILRCNECIAYFGDGLSDREKFIKWLKSLPLRIYYKIKRIFRKKKRGTNGH